MWNNNEKIIIIRKYVSLLHYSLWILVNGLHEVQRDVLIMLKIEVR